MAASVAKDPRLDTFLLKNQGRLAGRAFLHWHDASATIARISERFHDGRATMAAVSKCAHSRENALSVIPSAMQNRCRVRPMA